MPRQQHPSLSLFLFPHRHNVYTQAIVVYGMFYHIAEQHGVEVRLKNLYLFCCHISKHHLREAAHLTIFPFEKERNQKKFPSEKERFWKSFLFRRKGCYSVGLFMSSSKPISSSRCFSLPSNDLPHVVRWRSATSAFEVEDCAALDGSLSWDDAP